MNKLISKNGFTVVLAAEETSGHKALIHATAIRAGKTIGRSRKIETKLSFLGLFSLSNDKNVIEKSNFAIDMAINDAKMNLRYMVDLNSLPA